MLNIVDSEQMICTQKLQPCLLGMLNIVDSEPETKDYLYLSLFARYVKYCR